MREYIELQLPGPNRYTDSFFSYWRRAHDLLGCDLIIDGGVMFCSEHGTEALKENLEKHERIIGELKLASAVDNFQSYLIDVLLEILDSEPRIISSGQTKNSDVFDAPDVESLKRQIIEKHVVNLGYKRVEELDEYFKNALKFPLTSSHFAQLRLTRIVQLRNIIAHNRGAVSPVFVSRAGSKADVVGEPANMPNVFAVQNFLTRIALNLDNEAIQKFDLPTNNDEIPLPL